jgi:hypothetical protein
MGGIRGRQFKTSLVIFDLTWSALPSKQRLFRGRGHLGKEASDDRVERSLYQLAIGWNGQPPNTTAAIFWLKNRRPDRWRDAQQIQGDIGHYLLSDRPMTEDEWIEQRTKVIDAKPISDLDETGN